MRIEDAIKLKQSSFQSIDEEKQSVHSLEALTELKTAVRQVILEAFREKQSLFNEPQKIRQMVRGNLGIACENDFSHLLLSVKEKQLIIEDLIQNLIGFGAIDPYIKDPDVTESLEIKRRRYGNSGRKRPSS